jgi:hypothetical protein
MGIECWPAEHGVIESQFLTPCKQTQINVIIIVVVVVIIIIIIIIIVIFYFWENLLLKYILYLR